MAAEAQRAPVEAREQPTVAEKPSVILTLHNRYEHAWLEYNRIDRAQPAKPEDTNDDDWRRHYALGEAMLVSNAETDLLRMVILYQMPTTDEELTILSYHVHCLLDLRRGRRENEALALGVQSIFDYLVTEGRADVDLGAQFRTGAILAFAKVQDRFGMSLEER